MVQWQAAVWNSMKCTLGKEWKEDRRVRGRKVENETGVTLKHSCVFGFWELFYDAVSTVYMYVSGLCWVCAIWKHGPLSALGLFSPVYILVKFQFHLMFMRIPAVQTVEHGASKTLQNTWFWFPGNALPGKMYTLSEDKSIYQNVQLPG